MDGGDLAVADLVQNLGAEGAWAKIIEGALGEPAAERASRVSMEVVELLAQAAAMHFIVPGDDEWPDGLDDLRHAESVQRRGGVPLGLWLRGTGHLAHPDATLGCDRRLAGSHGLWERHCNRPRR
jgi:DNA processing protein